MRSEGEPAVRCRPDDHASAPNWTMLLLSARRALRALHGSPRYSLQWTIEERALRGDIAVVRDVEVTGDPELRDALRRARRWWPSQGALRDQWPSARATRPCRRSPDPTPMDLTLGVALLGRCRSRSCPRPCCAVVPGICWVAGAVVSQPGPALRPSSPPVSSLVARSWPPRAGAIPHNGCRSGTAVARRSRICQHSWVNAHGLAALPNAIAFVSRFGEVLASWA